MILRAEVMGGKQEVQVELPVVPSSPRPRENVLVMVKRANDILEEVERHCQKKSLCPIMMVVYI